MTETKKFRGTATAEERKQVLERVTNGESSPSIAFDMELTVACVCGIRNEAVISGEIPTPEEWGPKLTAYAVQQYCRDKELFTCGTREQYEHMSHLVDIGFPLHDIATMIWICSDGRKHAEEIEQDLRALGKKRV